MSIVRYGEMLGQSEEMRRIFDIIRSVAPTNASVLIGGESGTGKELVARAIHNESQRRKGPFIALNCGAFPREILENEIFGHEKGAFTGATNEKPGSFEQAHGGTLFLDEVAEMDLDIQVKFLRALEQRSFRRLGGRKEVQVDIRVVAATNKDVDDALRLGKLREDLYYRLAVITIIIPPLRDRDGDARLLAQEFLARYSAELGKEITGLSEDALKYIESYRWPGNVRELKNAVERAVILAQQHTILITDFLPTSRRGETRERASRVMSDWMPQRSMVLAGEAFPADRAELAAERHDIRSGGTNAQREGVSLLGAPVPAGLDKREYHRLLALQAIEAEGGINARGSIKRAAARLGVKRTTLWRWRNGAG